MTLEGVFSVVAGLLILLFLGYWLAHTWVIRPLIERIPGGRRFPFLDRVFPR